MRAINFQPPSCLTKRGATVRNWKRDLQTWRRFQHNSPSKANTSSNASEVEQRSKGTPLKDRILSIPGPSWLWTHAQPLTYPIRAYSRAQNKHPYLVQILSSLAIYFMGDLSSQIIQGSSPQSLPDQQVTSFDTKPGEPASVGVPPPSIEDEEDRFQYDPERSKRALIIGGLFSLPSYHWFLFLSRNFNLAPTMPYSTVLSLAIKVTVNQIIFAPLFNTYFFGMQSLLSGRSLSTRSDIVSDQTRRPTGIFNDFEGRLGAAWERVKETVPISWYNSCKFWPLVTAFSFTFVQPQSRSVFAGIVAIGWQSYLGLVNQRAVQRARESQISK